MKYLIKNINDYNDEYVFSFYESIYKEKQNKIDKLLEISEKKKSIISEIMLKELLKEYNIEYDKCVFSISDNGKPYIKNYDIYFSISHSKNYVAVVVSNNNIGIDIEETKEIDNKLLEYISTNEEKEFIKLSNNKNNTFLILFTLKESYIKLNDLNLSDLKNINVVKNNKLYIDDCNIINIINSKYSLSICEKK